MATLPEESLPAKTAAAISEVSPVSLRRWRRMKQHTEFRHYVKRFDGRYYHRRDGMQALMAASFN